MPYAITILSLSHPPGCSLIMVVLLMEILATWEMMPFMSSCGCVALKTRLSSVGVSLLWELGRGGPWECVEAVRLETVVLPVVEASVS